MDRHPITGMAGVIPRGPSIGLDGRSSRSRGWKRNGGKRKEAKAERNDGQFSKRDVSEGREKEELVLCKVFISGKNWVRKEAVLCPKC